MTNPHQMNPKPLNPPQCHRRTTTSNPALLTTVDPRQNQPTKPIADPHHRNTKPTKNPTTPPNRNRNHQLNYHQKLTCHHHIQINNQTHVKTTIESKINPRNPRWEVCEREREREEICEKVRRGVLWERCSWDGREEREEQWVRWEARVRGQRKERYFQ